MVYHREVIAMSRINAEPLSTQVTDYYNAMKTAGEVDEIAPAPPAPAKQSGALLCQQMQETLQNFQGCMNSPDETTKGQQLGKSLAAAETVKKGLSLCASQPNVDMNSLMLEMNKLLSKLRDLQRDHAIQQQQQAITLQEKAYQKSQDAIDKDKSAARTTAIIGGVGTSIGLLGVVAKGKGATSKCSAKSKQFKVNQLIKNQGMSEGDAFSEVNKKDATSQWQKIKNSKKNPTNWGSTPNSEAAIQAKLNRNTWYSGIGEMAEKLSPSLGQFVAPAAAMGDTAEAKQFNVEADRDKGLQSLNECEQGIRDEQARAASQQMRDVQREMNDLYGKIATAVRW